MKFMQLAISLVFLCSAFNCGYHLVGKDAQLPGGVSKIYVEPAQNQTREPALEQLFTQALLEQIQKDPRVKLTTKDDAEGFLRVELVELREQPLGFDRFGRATLLEVELSLRVMLFARKENKKLWDSGMLRAREEYPLSDDFLRNDQLRDYALNQICQRLSRTAVELLASDF